MANLSKWANGGWLRRAFSWQTGYTAFSVSQSKLSEVKAYISRQEKHHRKLTYQEEVVALLKKHGVEFCRRGPYSAGPDGPEQAMRVRATIALA